ncbi:MAG: transketolase [Candidatus Altiarchaeota archaeon]|nr:transketolase [Candidatus Altiarchaeota archaeon]
MTKSLKELGDKARDIRQHVVTMIEKAGSGHPGGSLSCVDIITTLYFYKMRHKPEDPGWVDRDRFVLCKGHAAPTLYAALAEAGYFPREELKNLRKFKSMLQGHPDRRKTPGVEFSSGSLGQGLSVACGMAMAGKLDKKDYRVYALLGDGECDEGQVWEAAMLASQYKIDNLIAIVDRNGLQIDGPTERVMSLEPFSRKWEAFGWHVLEIDGHNIEDIIHALDEAGKVKRRPVVIIAHLIKGKGVSFMEWMQDFHGKAPTKEELGCAITELSKNG